MKFYACTCGNTLFFDNAQCLRCGKMTGFCPTCRRIVPLEWRADGGMRCGWNDCATPIVRCYNYQVHDVCNWTIASDKVVPEPADLCHCCRFTQTIPNLSVEGNYRKWYRLERDKRRLLYNLDLLGLPYGTAADNFHPPLAFDFKADVDPVDEPWHVLSDGDQECVVTGHAQGRITINIREADDVERERLRVDFGESHRTLIGHFRHEIGHYYWMMLVQNQHEDEAVRLFGDPNRPLYTDAMARYYEQGPPTGWEHRFISAYASMHPWEDWAETFAAYLDMIAMLDTARNIGFTSTPPNADFDKLVVDYQRLGIGVNELNRGMGLLDLVPDVLVRPVVQNTRPITRLCPHPPPHPPPINNPPPPPRRPAVGQRGQSLPNESMFGRHTASQKLLCGTSGLPFNLTPPASPQSPPAHHRLRPPVVRPFLNQHFRGRVRRLLHLHHRHARHRMGDRRQVQRNDAADVQQRRQHHRHRRQRQ